MTGDRPDPAAPAVEGAGPIQSAARLGLRPRLFVKGLILIATLVALGYLLKVSGLGSALDTAWIDDQVRGKGVGGEALFVGVGALFIAFGLPRQLVCFLAGYAFGLGLGTALALAASVAGCVLAFFYARLIGRELVEAKFAARIRRVDAFLRDNPMAMTLLIRFLPVGSNLLTNLLAGVSGVRWLPFVVGSAIGYVPQTVIFVLLGSGMNIDPVFRITLSVALFLAAGVLGVYLYRRFRRGRQLDDDLQALIEDDGSVRGGR